MKKEIVCGMFYGLLSVLSCKSMAQTQGKLILENFGEQNPVDLEITSNNLLVFKDYPPQFVGSLQLKFLSSPLFREINEENCQKIARILSNPRLPKETRLKVHEDLILKTKVQLSIENYPLLNKPLILSKIKDTDITNNTYDVDTLFFTYPFSKIKIQTDIKSYESSTEELHVDVNSETSTKFERSLPILIHEPTIGMGVINGEDGCSLISGNSYVEAEFIFVKEEEEIIGKSKAKLFVKQSN
jgi:hypothetical protein